MNVGKGFFSRNRRTGFDHLGWVLQLSDLTPQNNSLEELIMKICWDNLEGLRYSKKKGKWYDKYYHYYVYKEFCETCKEPFLGREESDYCCKSCSIKNRDITKKTKKKMSDSGKIKIFTKVHRKHLSKSLKGRIFSKEWKKGLSKSSKGSNNSSWKGGYNSNNIPMYDTYAPQLEWCEEVRRSPTDRNILEVRCFKCDEWFIPKLYSVNSRIQVLKGNGKGEQSLYCSDKCKHSCSIYNKSPQQIMKEDAVRAGRLSWLELDREVQPELKKMVLERDEYQCIKCGSKNNLHCHHIYPVSTNPLESADIDNCITLCYTCHKKVHQKDGCRYGQLRIEVC